MAKITNILTTIIMLLVFLQITPGLVKNISKQFEEMFEPKVKVGLLKINEPITEIGYYLKYLKSFFENNEIKAIRIDIESPGGTAGASKALFDEILSQKKDHPKPVVILTNDLCASGAYYIACAGDHIVASSSAIVGSIGSYIGTFKIKEFVEQWKIKYNLKQSGKFKTSLNPFADNSPEINEFLQYISDDVYNQFKNDVATRRKLSLADSDKWANGKFFTGKQALALGLIDGVGSEYNAIKKIRELAMIEKEKKIEWIKPAKPGFFEQLAGSEDSKPGSHSFLDIILDKIFIKLGIDQSKPVSY